MHRIGSVPVGEASVAIAVSTPHRASSFEAAEWLINTLKTEVPIWKRECFADGSQEWVHPDPEPVQRRNPTMDSDPIDLSEAPTIGP